MNCHINYLGRVVKISAQALNVNEEVWSLSLEQKKAGIMGTASWVSEQWLPVWPSACTEGWLGLKHVSIPAVSRCTQKSALQRTVFSAIPTRSGSRRLSAFQAVRQLLALPTFFCGRVEYCQFLKSDIKSWGFTQHETNSSQVFLLCRNLQNNLNWEMKILNGIALAYSKKQC